jgi:methylmalonyl-CoA carboxyltransferase 12S subunit
MRTVSKTVNPGSNPGSPAWIAAERNARAINAATLFELDDVIDPAQTRSLIASTLAAASTLP